MPEGNCIHQAKYTRDMLMKFSFGDELKPQPTPMSSAGSLEKDEDGVPVDQMEYRGMIGSLLYLTATRPDILFAVRSVHAFRRRRVSLIGTPSRGSSGTLHIPPTLAFSIRLLPLSSSVGFLMLILAGAS